MNTPKRKSTNRKSAVTRAAELDAWGDIGPETRLKIWQRVLNPTPEEIAAADRRRGRAALKRLLAEARPAAESMIRKEGCSKKQRDHIYGLVVKDVEFVLEQGLHGDNGRELNSLGTLREAVSCLYFCDKIEAALERNLAGECQEHSIHLMGALMRMGVDVSARARGLQHAHRVHAAKKTARLSAVEECWASLPESERTVEGLKLKLEKKNIVVSERTVSRYIKKIREKKF